IHIMQKGYIMYIYYMHIIYTLYIKCNIRTKKAKALAGGVRVPGRSRITPVQTRATPVQKSRALVQTRAPSRPQPVRPVTPGICPSSFLHQIVPFTLDRNYFSVWEHKDTT